MTLRAEVDSPDKLFLVMPEALAALLEPRITEIEEIKLRLGQPLGVCIGGSYEAWPYTVSEVDCETVETALMGFRSDGRAGIPGTVHRISKRPNRYRATTGLTVRIGRFVVGVAEPLRAWLERRTSILLLGPPGVGKSTLMRDMIRIASEVLKLKGITVDTSGELAGDGDVPHPALGYCDVMPVPDPSVQEAVIAAAIKNHNPTMLFIDEIGYNGDADIIARAATKGIRVWATAHGETVKHLAGNADLDPVLGMPDRDRNVFTTDLTFETLIVVPEKGVYLVYEDLARTLMDYRDGVTTQPVRVALETVGAA